MRVTPAVLLLVLPAVLGSFGCGKEVGRIRLSSDASGAVVLALNEGEVSFWTDIDIAYEGDATLAYKVDLYQAGSRVAQAECNPLGKLPAKVSWVETNIGASHSRRGNGKMECEAKLPAAGETTVKATLAFAKRPATLSLKKADLVVKQ